MSRLYMDPFQHISTQGPGPHADVVLSHVLEHTVAAIKLLRLGKALDCSH